MRNFNEQKRPFNMFFCIIFEEEVMVVVIVVEVVVDEEDMAEVDRRSWSFQKTRMVMTIGCRPLGRMAALL